MRCLRWTWLALAVSASACAAEEEPERTRAEFCFEWASAACSEEVVSACQAEDVDACLGSQEDFCDELVPPGFSDAQGDDCLNAVADAYADADLTEDELLTVLRLAEPCDAIVVGSRDEGEGCEQDFDCDVAAGYRCVTKVGSEQAVCEMPEEVEGGRSCEAAQTVCEPGFFCDGSNCIEARDLGEDCELPQECGETGFCNAQGECEERYAVNEPCDEDGQCRSGVCYEFEGDLICTDRIRLSRAEPLCAELM